MKNVIWIALVCLALGMLSACGDGNDNDVTFVQQTTLYGTTLGPSESSDPLVLLNPNTGAYIRTVGPTGYFVSGLVYDKTTGKLFATTSAIDPVFPAGLIEINTVTGEGTEIGLTGLTAAATLTVDSAGQLYTWSPQERGLATIDKLTGVAMLVGNSGLDNTQALGLDFNALGNLVLVNGDGQIYEIDTITSASSQIGGITEIAHHGKFHPTTGLYWGIDATLEGDIPDRNLLVVDISASTILETHSPGVDYLHTIAFVSRLVPVYN